MISFSHKSDEISSALIPLPYHIGGVELLVQERPYVSATYPGLSRLVGRSKEHMIYHCVGALQPDDPDHELSRIYNVIQR